MPLLSSEKTSRGFFWTQGVVMDTCGVKWFLERPDGMAELKRIQHCMTVIVPLPVLYEIGFGKPEDVSPNEKEFHEVFSNTREIPIMKLALAHAEGQPIGPGIGLVNPGWEEWYSSRNRIIQHVVNVGNAKMGVQKKELSLDALIHACGRNLLLPICTENLVDFLKMNRAAESTGFDEAVPLFKPEQLLAALESDQYPVDPA
jgi:hypothetical protein